jgi:hypothetical protein
MSGPNRLRRSVPRNGIPTETADLRVRRFLLRWVAE